MIDPLSSTPVKFIIVGASLTALYFVLVFTLLTLGLGPIGASLLSYAIALAAGYSAQSRWTFGKGRVHRRSLARYITVQLSGAILSATAAHASSLFGFSTSLVSFFATITAGVVSYFLTSLWAFPRAL
jgi:putative flippase GtrA